MEEGLDRIREIIGDPEKSEAVIAIIGEMKLQEKQRQRDRQAAGIAAAQKRGVQFGRPKLEIPEAFPAIYALHKSKKISSETASQLLHISRKTYRSMKIRYEQELAEQEGMCQAELVGAEKNALK